MLATVFPCDCIADLLAELTEEGPKFSLDIAHIFVLNLLGLEKKAGCVSWTIGD